METSIVGFHQCFYILAIQKLAFNLLHVHMIGTRHCGNTRRDVFKRHLSYQYILCRRDYAEFVIAIFAHQIESE